MLSVVIPTLDERHSIAETLDAVARLKHCGEVIVVDGGSLDGTIEVARARGAQVITAARGRGSQMHAGACATRSDIILFLHADTLPPSDAGERIVEAMRDSGIVGGNCRVRFDGDSRAARFLTRLYPRLRRIGLIYGDSGIFVRRDAYFACGGFRSYPIFEDLDLVRRLRRMGRMILLDVTVVTSSRRFERRSFALTFARWVAMQLLFWLGVNPHTLVRIYAPVRAARSCDER